MLTTHPILIESTAQLLSEIHCPSHFYPISSNYTIQSLTTQNCNENHSEQLQINATHSPNHSQISHTSSLITVNHNAGSSNLLISHQSMITCTKNAITPSYCNHFSTHFYTPIMHSPSFIMFLHYKSHPQQFSPMPTNAHSPLQIFSNFYGFF